jgi:glutamate-1-semialdehyde 2,1-aminomutase
LAAAELPVRVANLSTIWTICYTAPSRYNWMFQYYLRAAGLSLSWIGTGRLIFSLNYTDADFAEVAGRILSAAREMHGDGWWWPQPQLTNKAIRRRLLREMIQARWASTSPMGSISSPRNR